MNYRIFYLFFRKYNYVCASGKNWILVPVLYKIMEIKKLPASDFIQWLATFACYYLLSEFFILAVKHISFFHLKGKTCFFRTDGVMSSFRGLREMCYIFMIILCFFRSTEL